MRGKKGILAIAIVSALAVAITTAGATAGASSGNAVAAKKKCKKKKHASSAKRKRCKARKNVPQKSVVRATLNWSNGGASDIDVDLFVFDSSGRQAGNGTDAIPASVLSPDVTGPSGTETFTDLNGNQLQPLSFGVCYLASGSTNVDFTLTYITADGVSHTFTAADDLPPGPNQRAKLGEKAHMNFSGGPAIPDNYCPGTNLVT
jgi:hypothetical protein